MMFVLDFVSQCNSSQPEWLHPKGQALVIRTGWPGALFLACRTGITKVRSLFSESTLAVWLLQFQQLRDISSLAD